PEPTELPIEDVIAANGGIEPDSGIHKVVSSSNGISFDFDSKYVTTENAVGNIIVYAGMEPSIPFCTVSLIEDADAVAYLKEMAEGAEIELGNSLQTKPGEPALVNLGGREIYYIYYTFKSKDVGSVVINAYYAENLENGKVVVYNSSALEGQTADVDAILKLAIETFALAV
ncbi:MAG: hypothetical protein IJV41_04390, partial [Oscillospiraceae bacterium]|nr:hypothetical protein [Oscillospiraceae bacterium]